MVGVRWRREEEEKKEIEEGSEREARFSFFKRLFFFFNGSCFVFGISQMEKKVTLSLSRSLSLISTGALRTEGRSGRVIVKRKGVVLVVKKRKRERARGGSLFFLKISEVVGRSFFFRVLSLKNSLSRNSILMPRSKPRAASVPWR